MHMTQLYPNISHSNISNICDIFHFGKQKKLPFKNSTSHTQTKYVLLHFDIWGPISTQSVHGHKYFLTIIDEHSRFTWIICLKSKAEVATHVKTFITRIETRHKATPKTIRSDNGP